MDGRSVESGGAARSFVRGAAKKFIDVFSRTC
jgi:hypothetical protein